MPTYTVKNAILDLGFVEGCLQPHLHGGSPFEKHIWEVLDQICQRITMQGLGSVQTLYDIGIIRGAMWLTPLPGAYSDAMDRLMEFFVAAKVDWYQLPQPFTAREHEDPVLSEELRNEIFTDYAIEGKEYAAETAKRAGFDDEFVIDRIVPPRIRDAIEPKAPVPEAVESETTEPPVVPDEPGQSQTVKLASAQSEPRGSVAAGSAPRGTRGWTDEQRATAAERARGQKKPPFDEHLEAVKTHFDSGLPLDRIGDKYGCSGSHIRNFLKKHGMDPRRTVTGTHKGRPPLCDREIQLIIDEKAKGTPSKEIGEMIDRSQHAVDQKYGDLKKAGLVPEDHLSPEALAEKKRRQNGLVSEKMKAFHAGKQGPEVAADAGGPMAESPAARWKPSPLDPGDWPDVQAMLASGRTREAIAGDYDVPVDDLDAFIDERLRDVKGRLAAKEASPGEAHAPLQ